MNTDLYKKKKLLMNSTTDKTAIGLNDFGLNNTVDDKFIRCKQY